MRVYRASVLSFWLAVFVPVAHAISHQDDGAINQVVVVL